MWSIYENLEKVIHLRRANKIALSSKESHTFMWRHYLHKARKVVLAVAAAAAAAVATEGLFAAAATEGLFGFKG